METLILERAKNKVACKSQEGGAKEKQCQQGKWRETITVLIQGGCIGAG